MQESEFPSAQVRGCTVVIPTVGRPELSRAVLSARAQDGVAQVEVVVVVDKAIGQVEIPDMVLQLADQVVWTGGGCGGSAARNKGVDVASQPWVAFLDDDDEWRNDKLVSQLDLVEKAGCPEPVISSRQVQVNVGTGHESAPIPLRTIGPDEDVAEYLFLKRRPAGGRASMYTSSLLCSRDLAMRVRWDESLTRHQDWDWLVRLGRESDVRFDQHPEPLVRIQTGSRGSISAGISWESSLRWVDSGVLNHSPKVYVDFLTAQTLRYALASRSLRGVRAVLSRIIRARTMPSGGPILIAVAGLVPRRTIERLMTRIR